MGKHVVFLLHGIRTQAEWAQRVASIIEADNNMVARPIRYGFFDAIRFLLPVQKLRDKPIERITRLLRDELSRNPHAISVIAHSYGSYILSKIIEREPDLRFNRIILCGSIVREDFEWQNYGHRFGSQDADWQLVCDCGMRDVWPVLAQTITWGYGSSGRFGFGHPRVKDRFFNLGHSGFFTSDFMRTYWIPYLSSGKINAGEIERATTPWWLSIVTVIKLKWLICSALLVATFWVANAYISKEPATDSRHVGTAAPAPAEIPSPSSEPGSTASSGAQGNGEPLVAKSVSEKWKALNESSMETELISKNPQYAASLFLQKPLKDEVKMLTISMLLSFDDDGSINPQSTAAGLRFYDNWNNPRAYLLGMDNGCPASGTKRSDHVEVAFAKCTVTISGDVVGDNFRGRVVHDDGNLLGEFEIPVEHSLRATPAE